MNEKKPITTRKKNLDCIQKDGKPCESNRPTKKKKMMGGTRQRKNFEKESTTKAPGQANAREERGTTIKNIAWGG